MPDVYPIAERKWIVRRVRPVLMQMYGRITGFGLHRLPKINIEPEILVKGVEWDVELMLAFLKAGAWLRGEDWKTYSRYTLSKRLKVRADLIFIDALADIREMALSYQLEGGTFRVRDTLRKSAMAVLNDPLSEPRHEAGARLVLSLTHDNLEHTAIQPYHWIRLCSSMSDPNPVFSMALFSAERRRQKVTLTQFLRAKVHTSD